MNSKDKGNISEVTCIAALLRAGFTALKPFGDNERYDFVVEHKGCFERVQCKTARIRNGSVNFAVSSSQAHRGKGRQHYKGQIEKFMIYCPENDCIYMVPINECNDTGMTLRIDPPRNGQIKNIKYAKDYLFY